MMKPSAALQLKRGGSAAREPTFRARLILFAFALTAALASPAARAQEAGGNATNEANNPLTAKITVNLQDYYTPSFYGPLNSDANSLLLRGLIPMNLGGLPQLLRFTLPY